MDFFNGEFDATELPDCYGLKNQSSYLVTAYIYLSAVECEVKVTAFLGLTWLSVACDIRTKLIAT